MQKKLCVLCERYCKLNIAAGGVMWMERDEGGRSLLAVEPVVGGGRVAVLHVNFCPDCGRDLRKTENEVHITDESLEYLKKKAVEMGGDTEDALDSVINTCYWADKEKERKATEGTGDETGT